MRHLVGRILLLQVATAGVLPAQATWHLTVERGATAFSAAAHDTSTDRIEIRPWHPVIYSVRIARDGERIGVGLAVSHSLSPVGVNIGEFAVLPGEEDRLIEFAPELRLRIARPASGTTVRIHLGPVLDVWTPAGDDPRAVFGGFAGVTMSLPIAGKWRADLRADLAMTGSTLTKDEESDEIIRERTMRRGRLGIGITKRL